MAEAVIVGAVVGDAVSKSTTLIIDVINKTWYFKSQLKDMKENIDRMSPIAAEMEKLNKALDRSDEIKTFTSLLEQADNLVMKCQHIKLNLWKKYRHALKLDALNKSLRDFVTFHLTALDARNGMETLVEVKRFKNEKQRSGGWSSAVPPEKCVVIGFENQIRDVKAMLLKDTLDGDCSVVVVSAAGGCGKTTLVTKLCHDPQITGRFRGNIYFVTVSQSYDPKVIVTKLLGDLPSNSSNEAAIQQWGSFLGQNESEILLVLDDVWSESVITDFKFKSPKYKVLVASRMIFTQFQTYELQVLSNQDATHLFRRSAFSEHGNDPSNIPNDLIDELVTCCKNQPLALSVIGGSLKDAHVVDWEYMLKELSKEKKSLSDLNEAVHHCLEKNLYFLDKEPKMKQCYLDLGLFPEDQKIAATALLDMWAHLYNHDDGGLESFKTLNDISSRNLASVLPIKKRIPVIANYCEEEFVTQHDMLRDLAIRLSSQEAIADRDTLIINPYGQENGQLPRTVNARILSISTDERFALTWNGIFQAPKVEVFVLNFMSEMHPLPQFMQTMEMLKVLIITNYGYDFADIQSFPAPQYLSGLTRIRLDHVSITSISSTILMLQNLQKLSLIMSKIGNSFDDGIANKLTNLLEIDIDSCGDFVTFPAVFCNSRRLKKLSITNCHELTSFAKDFGKLSNLEVLRIASCSKLSSLPESMRCFKKLRIVDLSNCLSLRELPLHIGELYNLQTIDASGCTNLHELPRSVKDIDNVKVFCDEETFHLWSGFKNLDVKVVEDDKLDTLFKIIQGHSKRTL